MTHSHEHQVTDKNKRIVLTVIVLTVITMFAEIIFGYLTHSMALLADGFHMGTHALALSLTYVAYIFMHKFEGSDSFPFGTYKIGALAGYTSSLFLGATGIWIIVEAVERMINPIKIQFGEALLVALIGLVVNLICILAMNKGSHCHCENDSDEFAHDIHGNKEDYNFLSAYYHILADILTSVLAIVALIAGKYFDILYLDAIIGILGGIMIFKWSVSLVKQTVKILIDMKN